MVSADKDFWDTAMDAVQDRKWTKMMRCRRKHKGMVGEAEKKRNIPASNNSGAGPTSSTGREKNLHAPAATEVEGVNLAFS